MNFVEITEPDDTQRDALAAAYPDNVFCTVGYANAIRGAGRLMAIFAINDSNGKLVEGCYGFYQEGRLTNTLELYALPSIRNDEIFFGGIRQTCLQRKVGRLLVNTLGADRGTGIPPLGRAQTRSPRFEYRLDLCASEPLAGMSTNPKRNLKKARKAEAELIEVTSADSVAVHARLMSASIDRRNERGEQLAEDLDTSGYQRFLDTGAGVIFQLHVEGEPVSSILVLLAESGAYYHSAGTSPAGMKVGASVCLISDIAVLLKDRGFTIFNLGGTRPGQDGLRRFKLGFGAEEIELESSTAYFGSRIRQLLASGYHRIRNQAERSDEP